MEKQLTLQEKISAITKEIGAIPKTKKPNSTVSYAFRGIDDVMNKLNPLLAHHGITLQNKVLAYTITPREYIKKIWNTDKEEKKMCYYATVHIQLIFSDGISNETWEEVAMSEDHSDKALTQAMSMAYKYAITRKFCILTEDLVDPDGLTPDRLKETPNQQQPNIPIPQPTTPPPTTSDKLTDKDMAIFTELAPEIKSFTKGSELRANANDIITKAKHKGISAEGETKLKARIEKTAASLIAKNS